jgi:nucleoid-associated protein YgaU
VSRLRSSDPQVERVGRPGESATSAASTPQEARGQADAAPVATGDDHDQGGFAVHVVQPGETLRIIARDRLGDPRRTREIIELNRELLGADGRIRVRQRLILPADARPSAPGP